MAPEVGHEMVLWQERDCKLHTYVLFETSR